MITKEDLIEKVFKQCLDPELHIDVWTLGLIYDTKIVEGKGGDEGEGEGEYAGKKESERKGGEKVLITMTFTSPFCPYGPQLVDEIKNKVKEIGGEAEVTITFEPPWEPSEELKVMMGY